MVRLLVPLETASDETRVAATPETVKRFLKLGCKVCVEQSAGLKAGFSDENYREAGAQIIPKGQEEYWRNIDILLCVQLPKEESLCFLSSGTLVVGLLAPYGNEFLASQLTSNSLSAISLELLPRISRAQPSDALSSQSNVAGYKSVLIAASNLDRYFPMLMTAAGTVQPAKVLILGAGVAGLQAVATAKRLGAVVYVSDIRPAVKEQVESLGARFIEPPNLDESPSESGGYAKQVSTEFLEAQQKELFRQLSDADVAICTALVPGKKAPLLITEKMLDQMRPGSVVVDLAVDQGGNCFGTKKGETVVRNGVKLIGAGGLACSVANHSSDLYSRNLLSLLSPIVNDGQLFLNLEDELIDGTLISKDGEIRHPQILKTS